MCIRDSPFIEQPFAENSSENTLEKMRKSRDNGVRVEYYDDGSYYEGEIVNGKR